MSSTTGTSGTRNCVSCGRAIAWDANVCPYCGHDYRAQFVPAQQPSPSGRARTGAILILVSGVLAVLMGIAAVAASTVNFESMGATFAPDFTQKQLQELLLVFGIVALALGIVAVIGGMFGLERRHFGIVIAGGICGIVGIGFFLGTVLAVIGLILVALGRSEFEAPPAAAPTAQPPYQYR